MIRGHDHGPQLYGRTNVRSSQFSYYDIYP